MLSLLIQVRFISAASLIIYWKELIGLIDFVENVPINDIQESEYNPRVITPDALVSLQKSLLRFGMVKPLIINDVNNVIIAGHQRKKAALCSRCNI